MFTLLTLTEHAVNSTIILEIIHPYHPSSPSPLVHLPPCPYAALIDRPSAPCCDALFWRCYPGN